MTSFEKKLARLSFLQAERIIAEPLVTFLESVKESTRHRVRTELGGNNDEETKQLRQEIVLNIFNFQNNKVLSVLQGWTTYTHKQLRQGM